MIIHSKLNIESDRKVDVVLSVMNSMREQIGQWHNRSYSVATWSIVVLLGIVAYWFKSGNSADKEFFVIGMFLFVIMSQIYLHFSQDAIKKNGRVLAKCETVLRLTEQDTYVCNDTFFDPSPTGEWVTPVEIKALRWFHLVVGLIAIAAIILLKKSIHT